jgi:hypothetical protein
VGEDTCQYFRGTLLPPCVGYSSTMLVEAVESFRTLVDIQAVWHHIPEGSKLDCHYREDLETHERNFDS